MADGSEGIDGLALKFLRLQAGVRQAAVARYMGTSRQRVTALERRGARPTPEAERRYLQALNLAVGDL
jgi:transcriptional regulator with XRE-family HTH domain